jgi:hypothetical protein
LNAHVSLLLALLKSHKIHEHPGPATALTRKCEATTDDGRADNFGTELAFIPNAIGVAEH